MSCVPCLSLCVSIAFLIFVSIGESVSSYVRCRVVSSNLFFPVLMRRNLLLNAERRSFSKMSRQEEKKTIPNGVRFCLGGLSGMCGVPFTHPMEFLKIRMQKSGEMGVKRHYKTMFHAVYYSMKNEGIFSIYNGLTASLLRQGLYQTTRLGIYTSLLEWYISRKDVKHMSFAMKCGLGMIAGALGGFAGVPAEVVLVRMTLDGRLPVEERRNYKNVIHALYKITKQEGATAMFAGSEATVIRSSIAGAVTLATYSQTKQALLDSGYFKENIPMYFTASMVSGFATAIFVVPADMAKTRIQDMRKTGGGPVYKNTIDVWVKTVKHEGVLALWKGFNPYYMRLGPQTVLMFIFLEKFTRGYAKYILKNDEAGRVM